MNAHLHVVHRSWLLGGGYDEVVWEGEPRPTLADTAFTVVAATMGAVLRKALADHLAEHRCNTAEYGPEPCEEKWRLFDLLPQGDQVIVG